MADTEQIEFTVLVDGEPVEYFTVPYSDTFNGGAISQYREEACEYAREHGGEVEKRTTYVQDREIIYPDPFGGDDDD